MPAQAQNYRQGKPPAPHKITQVVASPAVAGRDSIAKNRTHGAAPMRIRRSDSLQKYVLKHGFKQGKSLL